VIERETLLPIGLEDASGRLRRTATLRKMRGHEEALLYDPSLSAGRLVTELLAGCLTRLGEDGEVTVNDVRRLYSADRNYLLLEIRRFTLGDAMACAYGCPACGAHNRVVEDLGRVDVRRYEGDRAPESVSITLEDGYRDGDGAVHRDLRLRLPRGDDEEFVAETAERDPLRARDALILCCIDQFGALPRAAIEAYGLKMLRDLTLGDRRLIYQAMDAGAPGVDFRRQLHCSQCDAPFEAFLEASNFFLLN